MKKISVLSTLILMTLGMMVQAETVTLTSAADTYMRDATIYGANAIMDIRGGGVDFAGYLRFDLSSLGAIEITSAQVVLTVNGSGASRNDSINTARFALYGLNDVAGNTPQNWDEATLSETGTVKVGAEWTNVMPMVLTGGRVVNLDGGEANVTETVTGAGGAGTTANVSGPALVSFLQDRVFNGTGLATFIIGNDDGTDRGYGLATKENANAAYRPKLIVAYTRILTSHLPNPADGAIVPANLTELSWRNPDPNNPGDTITSDVYLGTDPNTWTKIADDTPLTTVTIPFALAPATYFWKVNSNDPNAGLIQGPLWSFTASAAPEITAAPADAAAFEGGSAVFAAQFKSLSAVLSNKWYKAGEPVVEMLDTDADVTIGLAYDALTGTYTSTLELTGLTAADDGHYYCAIQNAGGTSNSQSAKLIIKRMVAYWPLNGDAADATGIYNGTLAGAPVFESAGKVGQAMIFDGTDDYVDLPDGFSDFTQGITVAVWANPSAVTNFARFIDFGNGEYNNNIYLARNGTTANLSFGIYKGTVSIAAVTATNALSLNEWQMFVATLNESGSVVLYKNGLPVQTGTLTQMPDAVVRTINYLGESNWAADAFYSGMMDDMRIYNYGITADQVADLYTGVVGSYCRTRPVYDYDGNCVVSLGDFVYMADYWLDCGFYPDTNCGN